MSSLVMEIEDYALSAGVPLPVSRTATYFLLMTGSDVDVQFSYKGTRIGGGVGLQGGDAIGPLSQPYDQVKLTSATAQTVKIATSSDPVTITRLSGTVKVAGVVETAPDFSRVIRSEAFYGAHTAPATAGEYGWLQLWNPAGSGKRLVVPSLFFKGGVSFDFFLTEVEATAANLNGYDARAAQCMKVENPPVLTADLIMRRGTSASTTVLAGTGAPGIGTYSVDQFQGKLPFVLTPGNGLAFRTLAVNTAISFGAQLFEEVL